MHIKGNKLYNKMKKDSFVLPKNMNRIIKSTKKRYGVSRVDEPAFSDQNDLISLRHMRARLKSTHRAKMRCGTHNTTKKSASVKLLSWAIKMSTRLMTHFSK